MNLKTAKKESKWRRAWLRCFTTSTRNNPDVRMKRRTSKAKREKADRNYNYWAHKNEINIYFGDWIVGRYDKKQKCRVYEWRD